MANSLSKPVVIVEAMGKPVTQVAAGTQGTPATVVEAMGEPITLVDAQGYPMELWNPDGTEYSAAIYVSAAGDDGDAGTLAEPVLTLAQAVTLAGTDGTLRLNRGDTWRELLTCVAGLTVTNYGSGALPIITGADTVTGKTQESGGDAHRWSKTLATEPSQVFIDGVRGLRVASAGAVDTYRDWHWASNTLTVYANDTSTEPTVEVSLRAAAIDTNAEDGVTIDGVAAVRGLVCIDGDDASGLTITGCDVTDGFVEGIISNSTGAAITDLAITGNTISGCGGTGIQFNLAHDGVLISGNTIHSCCQLHEDQTGGHSRQEFSAAIKFWGDEENDIFTDVQIIDNDIHDMGAQYDLGSSPQVRGVGIWGDHYYYSSPSGYPVLISGNAVARVQSNGIYLEKTEASRVTDCAVLDAAYGASGTGTTQFRAGIMVESNDAPAGDCIGNLVDHCTNVGGFWGLGLNSGATANVLSTNTVRDCVSVGAGQNAGADGLNLYASDTVNDTTHGIGNTVANCNLGADRASIARWPTTTYSNVATMDTAVAAISNMVSGDPVFVDAVNDDYRLDAGSPCLNAGSDGSDLGASDAVLLRLKALA